MTTTTEARTRSGRLMINKVPEVTLWFWVIKVLCTTVGESFADWINTQLGVGLVNTAWIFTAVFVAVLAVQLRSKRYVPFAYWLTVSNENLFNATHHHFAGGLCVLGSLGVKPVGSW